jgi:hypothetical protein
MSTPRVMLEADDLSPTDEKILDMLREGRVTAPFVAHEKDVSLQYARDRLGRMVEHGNARKVYEGLYELVDDPREAADTDTEPVADPVEVTDGTPGVEFPATVDGDDARAAVTAAAEYLREHSSATKGEIVRAVMPDHALGYDVDDALAKLDAGDRYRGAWWRRVVSPGLEARDDVEKPTGGRSEWRYIGGE